jgi:hypothetical protein
MEGIFDKVKTAREETIERSERGQMYQLRLTFRAIRKIVR